MKKSKKKRRETAARLKAQQTGAKGHLKKLPCSADKMTHRGYGAMPIVVGIIVSLIMGGLAALANL